MKDLVRALAEAEQALERGTLRLEGLDRACDDARELYERLVVLRHKAREGARPVPPAATLSIAAEPAPAAGEPGIRLDTRVERPEARQTSLIDAIAETEGGKPKARPAKVEKAPAEQRPKAADSLADKLGKAPIGDLGKAVTLSQKFLFIAELFGGDRIRYDRTIEMLNTKGSLQEARALLEGEVLPALGKAPDESALSTFIELLERRYP